MIDTGGGLHNAHIIGLFGPTGSGKTTFANIASGDSMRVGRGLKSCTQKVESTITFTVDGEPVVVIDCPGFDDTYMSDSETLASLAAFLAVAYSQNFKFTGLLYLHKITDTRVGGTKLRHMNMFKELCGTDSLKNVAYVMNMWSDPPTEDELLRENELRHSDEFFGVPLSEGAQMTRHYNTRNSAHDIIRKLLPRRPTVPKFSKQLVDEGLLLEETSAGIASGLGLENRVSELNEKMRQLREDQAQAIRENDQNLRRMLEEQEREEWERDQILAQQLELLKEEHELDEAVWAIQFNDYTSAIDASFALTMSELLECLESEHEAITNSLLG